MTTPGATTTGVPTLTTPPTDSDNGRTLPTQPTRTKASQVAWPPLPMCPHNLWAESTAGAAFCLNVVLAELDTLSKAEREVQRPRVAARVRMEEFSRLPDAERARWKLASDQKFAKDCALGVHR